MKTKLCQAVLSFDSRWSFPGAKLYLSSSPPPLWLLVFPFLPYCDDEKSCYPFSIFSTSPIAIVDMRLSILASAFIGTAFVTASPILEHSQERSVEGDMVVVRDLTVVYEDCNIITPKVFIISMVSQP
jgi:hypothetical protein